MPLVSSWSLFFSLVLVRFALFFSPFSGREIFFPLERCFKEEPLKVLPSAGPWRHFFGVGSVFPSLN